MHKSNSYHVLASEIIYLSNQIIKTARLPFLSVCQPICILPLSFLENQLEAQVADGIGIFCKNRVFLQFCPASTPPHPLARSHCGAAPPLASPRLTDAVAEFSPNPAAADLLSVGPNDARASPGADPPVLPPRLPFPGHRRRRGTRRQLRGRRRRRGPLDARLPRPPPPRLQVRLPSNLSEIKACGFCVARACFHFTYLGSECVRFQEEIDPVASHGHCISKSINGKVYVERIERRFN